MASIPTFRGVLSSIHLPFLFDARLVCVFGCSRRESVWTGAIIMTEAGAMITVLSMALVAHLNCSHLNIECSVEHEPKRFHTGNIFFPPSKVHKILIRRRFVSHSFHCSSATRWQAQQRPRPDLLTGGRNWLASETNPPPPPPLHLRRDLFNMSTINWPVTANAPSPRPRPNNWLAICWNQVTWPGLDGSKTIC